MKKNVKKLLSVVLSVIMLLGVMPFVASAETVASGECGNNATWILDADGTLTISGTGKMYNDHNEAIVGKENSHLVKKVIIENGVTSIAAYAFHECMNLSQVEIPNTVTSIEERAFSVCSSLREISLPESLVEIGQGAFDSASLETIHIPENVTSIGYVPVLCDEFTSFTVDENNTVYTADENGVLFTKDMKTLVAYPNALPFTEYTIPEGVENIGVLAFMAAGNLKTVKMPDSVTKMDAYALAYAYNLKEILLSESLTSIGEAAFAFLMKLESISIPASVTEIGEYAFDMCFSLKDVTVYNKNLDFTGTSLCLLGYESTKENIRKVVDIYCEILSHLPVTGGDDSLLPDGIMDRYETMISEIQRIDGETNKFAVIHCPTDSLAKQYAIENNIAYDCVDCPHNGVRIYASVPATCTSTGLTEGRICDICETVLVKKEIIPTIPHDYAFGKCTVCLADEIIASGECGASSTWQLNGNGVLTISGTGMINANAFDHDFEYIDVNITSVVINEGITDIGDDAFDGCQYIESVQLPGSLRTIGEHAFGLCVSLEEIVIPEGVTSIGFEAFGNCASLKDVTLPDSLITIETNAFIFTAVETVHIPANTVIMGGSFVSDTFTGFTVDENNPYYITDENGILFTKDMKTLVAYPNALSFTEYTVPEGVEAIGEWAFLAVKNLKSLKMADSVTSIGDYAFTYAYGIEEIEFSDSLTSIGSQVFTGTAFLESVSLPASLTSIGVDAFYGCPALTEIIVYNKNLDLQNSKIGILDAESTEENISAMQLFWQKYVSSVLKYGSHENIKFPDELMEELRSLESEIEYIENEPNSFAVIYSYKESEAYNYAVANGIAFEEISCQHSEIRKTPSVDATCTEDGLTEGSKCSVCGEILVAQEAVPATGHHFIEGICSVCGQKDIIDSGLCCSNKVCSNAAWVLYADGTLVISGEGGVIGPTECPFSGCNREDLLSQEDKDLVKKIIFEEGITSIDDGFRGYKNVTEISFPESLTIIRADSFGNCTSLTEIIIPENVTEIGEAAFSLCSSLESVILPDTYIEIGRNAFSYTAIETLHIPKNALVKGLLCTSHVFTGYTVDEENPYHTADEYGALFTKDMKTLIAYPNASENKSYHIPEGVEAVDMAAFLYSFNLEKVTMADTVKTIGESAFTYSQNIKEIEFSSSLERIEYGAFISTSCTSISFPESIKYIGENAFEASTMLESVIIPDCDVFIEGSAFADCPVLKDITVYSENAEIAEYAIGYFNFIPTQENISNYITYMMQYMYNLCEYGADVPEDIYNEWVESMGKIEFADGQLVGELLVISCVLGSTAEAYAKENDISYKYICFHTETEVIPAVSASCMSTGLTEGKKCASCGEILVAQEIIEKNSDHKYSTVVTAPTCTAQGFTTYTCECGDSYVDDFVGATGHSFTDYSYNNNATCKEDGTKIALCDNNCGASDVITAEGTKTEDHIFGEWVLEEGKKHRICSVCEFKETVVSTDEGDVEIVAPENPELDFDVDSVDKNGETFLLVEQIVAESTEGAEVLKVFDISLKNKDGVHVQPDGTVKVKLPNNWEKGKTYKVYRVNEDGTLTDMEAYRQGSHVVFDTDHFSIYVIVEEDEKTEEETTKPPAEDTTQKPSDSTTDNNDEGTMNAFLKFIDDIVNFFVSLFNSIGDFFNKLKL